MKKYIHHTLFIFNNNVNSKQFIAFKSNDKIPKQKNLINEMEKCKDAPKGRFAFSVLSLSTFEL